MRFSEFFNFWKNKAIIDIGKVITGNTPPTKNSSYYGDSFNWAGPSDLGMSKYINDTKVKLSNDGMLVSRVIPKNSILVTCIGSTIGKMGISTKAMATNQQINSIIVNTKFNFEFIYYEILYSFKKYLKTIEVQAVPIISKSAFEKLKIYVPSIDEQHKLAKFLTLIDQRIDTQSKIIEDLELFKKGIWNYIYLTKSSDWKCVKLSDILCERKDFALKGDEFIHATLSKDGIFAKTDRYDRDFLVTNDEKEYKITRLNDICYNPANLKFGVICLNKFGDAIFSPIYVTYIVKNDFIPSFVELILTSSRFLKYIRKYEQGTVYERMAVNSEDFLKGEILIPTKDKQKAIADYFDMLDLKIKKEKDILELYKKQKAYLLKNMFI